MSEQTTNSLKLVTIMTLVVASFVMAEVVILIGNVQTANALLPCIACLPKGGGSSGGGGSSSGGNSANQGIGQSQSSVQ